MGLMRYLKEEGLYGWNYRYLLLHPWIVVEETYLRIKWFLQRGHRGYADCDAWSLDGYLSKWMPEAVRGLKGGQGFPANVYEDLFHPESWDAMWPQENCDVAQKRWREILEEIAIGFETARKIADWDYADPEELKAKMAVVDHGLDLFRKYYLNLWD